MVSKSKPLFTIPAVSQLCSTLIMYAISLQVLQMLHSLHHTAELLRLLRCYIFKPLEAPKLI